MTAPETKDRRRFRLATNDNETVVLDRIDRRRHRLAGNDNETVVTDDFDTEAHRLAGNDNETLVEGTAEDDRDAQADEPATAPGARRMRR